MTMNISKYCSKIKEFATKICEIISFKSSRSSMNEVLFYGSEDENERKKLGLKNLLCIYYVIIHASRSIDVCMPSLSSETICQSLIALQRNKVKVRVAIHASDSSETLNQLKKEGIAVKFVKSEKLEHDFILIDSATNNSVAVLGSLDYETARVNQNRDATFLTSDANLIKTLQREFERVWKSVSS